MHIIQELLLNWNKVCYETQSSNDRIALHAMVIHLLSETEEVETEHESPNEYVVPDEVITASNDAEETEYVVNELALYESYEDDDHAEEVYEDMEAVQNTDDYEELRAH